MIDDIHFLYRYNHWANTRYLDVMAKLSPEQFTREVESSFPSVKKTLHHMIFAEWLWLTRWKGNSPVEPPVSWDTTTFESMRQIFLDVHAAQDAFLTTLSNADLEKEIHYKRISGEPNQARLHSLMRHVVNHATYHRGQLTTLIRQVGGEVVSTDMLLFVLEERGS